MHMIFLSLSLSSVWTAILFSLLVLSLRFFRLLFFDSVLLFLSQRSHDFHSVFLFFLLAFAYLFAVAFNSYFKESNNISIFRSRFQENQKYDKIGQWCVVFIYFRSFFFSFCVCCRNRKFWNQIKINKIKFIFSALKRFMYAIELDDFFLLF